MMQHHEKPKKRYNKLLAVYDAFVKTEYYINIKHPVFFFFFFINFFFSSKKMKDIEKFR